MQINQAASPSAKDWQHKFGCCRPCRYSSCKRCRRGQQGEPAKDPRQDGKDGKDTQGNRPASVPWSVWKLRSMLSQFSPKFLSLGTCYLLLLFFQASFLRH